MNKLLKQLAGWAGPRLAGSRTARDLFFLAAQDFTPSLTANVGKYRYHVSTRDRTIGREVFLTGGFDAACIEHIFALLARLGFQNFQGKYFLDIGANIGTTSIPVVSERGFAGGFAVEPEPANFRLLRENIAANGLGETIQCIHAALSDCIGEAEMELCPVNLGDHRLRPRDPTMQDGIYREQQRALVTVPTTTFDALVASGTLQLKALGTVWIDTQGHEGQILKGAQTLLRSDVPVVAEFWPYALARAGGLDLFFQIAQSHYTTFLDVRATREFSRNALQPIENLTALAERYPGPAMTDLILLK